jgi:hypothetical protein
MLHGRINISNKLFISISSVRRNAIEQQKKYLLWLFNQLLSQADKPQNTSTAESRLKLVAIRRDYKTHRECMEKYTKHANYKSGMKCSVQGCTNLAEYEVVLYDYYDFANDTFYEQDYTCPFLCQKDLDTNEEKAIGERKPRAIVHYPFTNRHGAQGYNKYNPLKEVYPQLFSLGELENDRNIQIDLTEINKELIAYLAKHPEYMRQLHPRKFEELITEIIRSKGYDVTITPAIKDGGKDIIAIYKTPFGHQMFIVECKRYKEENKVGVEIVRALHGVTQAEKFNQAILVTTSTFTKGAIEFVKPLKFQLELKDYNDVTEWCKQYAARN